MQTTVDSAYLEHFGQRAFDSVSRKDTVLHFKNDQGLFSHQRKSSYKRNIEMRINNTVFI